MRFNDKNAQATTANIGKRGDSGYIQRPVLVSTFSTVDTNELRNPRLPILATRCTNAKGGQSYHNYGLALYLVEIRNGTALWNNGNCNKIGQLGRKLGFEWGGNFPNFVDNPHFQMRFEMHWKQLLNN